jgi:hypothetical protein
MLRLPVVLLLSASGLLAGCSDIYYDRRETVSKGAADAVASNLAVQTIDPWPRNVANQNIAMNGDRAALAIDRYRHGRVIPPGSTGTSSAGYSAQQQQQPQAAASPTSSAGTQVK